MEEYITRDLPLVVFLSLRGHDHQRIQRNGTRCEWVFAVVGDLKELVDSYMTSDDALVDVQDALDTGKRLREEMYDFMKGSRA